MDTKLWQDNITIYLKETRRREVDLINLRCAVHSWLVLVVCALHVQ
jgi:hypothetical protein